MKWPLLHREAAVPTLRGKAMMQQKPLCIVDSELSSEFFGRTFLESPIGDP